MYYDHKFLPLMKNVFRYMSERDRQEIPNSSNPLFNGIRKAIMAIVAAVEYYNYPEPVEVNRFYDKIQTNVNNVTVMQEFLNYISMKLIPETYHDQPYIKDMMVGLYEVVAEALAFTEPKRNSSITMNENTFTESKARILFNRLLLFCPRLEDTLERRAIKFGWHKRRKLKHNHIFAIASYVLHVIRPKKLRDDQVPATMEASTSAARAAWKPFSAEALEILAQLRQLATHLEAAGEVNALRRDIHDLEHLALATKEVYKTSLIITGAYVSGISGAAFTIGRIIGIAGVSTAAAWSFGTIGTIPALLSVHMLTKKLRILRDLEIVLELKLRESSRLQHVGLLRVREIVALVKWITAARITASGLAAVALPYGLAIGTAAGASGAVVPIALAGSALGLAAGSKIALLVVEYKVRYKLDTLLGEYVCTAFREEILDFYNQFKTPHNKMKTMAVQETEAWEYAAREFLHKYRFDAVFGSNRLGSILQYIQSGLITADMLDTKRRDSGALVGPIEDYGVPISNTLSLKATKAA